MDLCSIKDLKPLLERHGFKFSKSMGQNFLVAGWVPQNIADSADLDENWGVLEVGPGVGCLTEKLSQQAGRVVSVELDRRLAPLLAETLAQCPNVEIVNADILKTDIPALVDEKFNGLRAAACANLPYNITTPAISALIDSGKFETITVMIQREVARRICAAPGTGDYGAFTVYVNYYTEPEQLFDVPPGCFMPQPKVTSTVIRLKTRKKPPAEVKDEKLFFKTVRGAFAQRRKTLLNALSSSFGGQLKKEDIAAALEEADIQPSVRGETLDIGQFAALSNAIGERL
jgi:16S rRNA (adenine1518-N6/adenine1519-N6)-dimethyltransferase